MTDLYNLENDIRCILETKKQEDINSFQQIIAALIELSNSIAEIKMEQQRIETEHEKIKLALENALAIKL